MTTAPLVFFAACVAFCPAAVAVRQPANGTVPTNATFVANATKVRVSNGAQFQSLAAGQAVAAGSERQNLTVQTMNLSHNSSAMSTPKLVAADSSMLPHFLAQQDHTSSACACKLEETCSCTSTMKFMDCISAACLSGKCSCNETQFHHACLAISTTCSKLELECSNEEAACLYHEESHYPQPEDHHQTADEIHEELRELKEEKCRLQLQVEDGWEGNAETHLKSVNSEIDSHMQELETRNEKTPEMHCEKHFEEWHHPAPAALKNGVAFRGPAVVVMAALATAASV